MHHLTSRWSQDSSLVLQYTENSPDCLPFRSSVTTLLYVVGMGYADKCWRTSRDLGLRDPWSFRLPAWRISAFFFSKHLLIICLFWLTQTVLVSTHTWGFYWGSLSVLSRSQSGRSDHKTPACSTHLKLYLKILSILKVSKSFSQSKFPFFFNPGPCTCEASTLPISYTPSWNLLLYKPTVEPRGKPELSGRRTTMSAAPFPAMHWGHQGQTVPTLLLPPKSGHTAGAPCLALLLPQPQASYSFNFQSRWILSLCVVVGLYEVPYARSCAQLNLCGG
jgi:hypothetical protein